jgi:heptosyltransferase III
LNPFRGKILVIRGGAIGDFILTLPAIAALRRQFPDAYLEVLGYPHIVQLARAGGLVDFVRPIEARALAVFFARNGDLAEDMTDYFSEFDLIVSYLYDPDDIFMTNVCRCFPGQFVAGPHRPNEEAGIHAAKAFLKPLERLAIFDADPVPRLAIGPNRSSEQGENENQPDNGHPTLALHPGSGSERKNWAEAQWAELINQLIHSTESNLLLVGGEAEGERLQRLAAALPPTRARVAQSLPLAQLAGLLASCSAFIGHDSGISHLAAALGLPGLLLWGDSIEEIWRPPSDKMVVLRHPSGLEHLSVSEVFQGLNNLYSHKVP